MGMNANSRPVRSIMESNGTMRSKAWWITDAWPRGEKYSPLQNSHSFLISRGISSGTEPFLYGRYVFLKPWARSSELTPKSRISLSRTTVSGVASKPGFAMLETHSSACM